MPAISPDRHEDIAAKLEALDHAEQLPPDTHPTVVEVCFFFFALILSKGAPSDTNTVLQRRAIRFR